MSQLSDIRESLIIKSKNTDNYRVEDFTIHQNIRDVILITDNQELSNQLSQISSLDDWDKFTIIGTSNVDDETRGLDQEKITVLLDVKSLDTSDIVGYCKQVSSLFRNFVRILAIGKEDSLSLSNRLADIGVGYIIYCSDNNELSYEINKACEDKISSQSLRFFTTKRAKKISVIGTKGAVGVSTISCALANQLSLKSAKVLVTDYQQMTSDIDIILNINNFERFEIARDFEPDTVADINDIAFKFNENLSVLALKDTSDSKELAHNFQFNDHILDKIKTDFNFIVDDVPSYMVNTDLFEKIVDTSEIFVIVLEPTVPSIRNAKIINKLIVGNKQKPKVIFCMAHTKKNMDALLSVKESEQYLGHKIDFDIPYKKLIRRQILEGTYFSNNNDMRPYSDICNKITGSLQKKKDKKLFSFLSK